LDFIDSSEIEVNPWKMDSRPGPVWLAVMAILAGCLLLEQPAWAAKCQPEHGLTLQVLGSGGPVADDGRASSAYIVWNDGRARVLVDAGGGSFLRFGQAQARFEDLDLIAISHFHTDHSSDLPALLKSGYFSGRERSLVISGPEGDDPFPGLEAFIESTLDPGRGSYAYLAGYLDGSDSLVKLKLAPVAGQDRTVTVLEQGGLKVMAQGVPHGIVPTLAFRVEEGGQSIVFASDQNGSDSRFPDFAQGASILVAHLAISENTAGAARKLHAPASVIGQMASQSGAKILVLSHFMSRSLKDMDNSLVKIRLQFSGNIILAEDLQCIEAGQSPR
jgi:ribonuclease BN (tRNA processing enzyme)